MANLLKRKCWFSYLQFVRMLILQTDYMAELSILEPSHCLYLFVRACVCADRLWQTSMSPKDLLLLTRLRLSSLMTCSPWWRKPSQTRKYGQNFSDQNFLRSHFCSAINAVPVNLVFCRHASLSRQRWSSSRNAQDVRAALSTETLSLNMMWNGKRSLGIFRSGKSRQRHLRLSHITCYETVGTMFSFSFKGIHHYDLWGNRDSVDVTTSNGTLTKLNQNIYLVKRSWKPFGEERPF